MNSVCLGLQVLLVDDESSIRASVGEVLRRLGCRVLTVSDGSAAQGALERQNFDLVLCDVRLPGIDGFTLLRQAKARALTTDFIMMTGYASVEDAVTALKEGAIDYLAKPFNIDELISRVTHFANDRLHKRELSDEPMLIGRSPKMLGLFERIDKFAAADAPMMITGESGTGKELVALAVHRRSARSHKPFLAINCAAFPETLLEAELFGHERGAFTGAVKKREGRFKAAEGGTLLLDEVGELPFRAQAKLLRVLQEHAYEPLGTNQSVKIDVRVLAATHQNLREMVAQGTFRSDLYYRLKILEVEVPALREREGDFPLLLQHFLDRYSPSSTLAITARAMAALSEYNFPGNVRELEHAIRHAVAMTGGVEDIDLMHLPTDICGKEVAVEALPSGIQPLPHAMREFEREYLRRALAVASGSKSKTASLLGISRKNLWEKLKRYEIAEHLDAEPLTHPMDDVPRG